MPDSPPDPDSADPATTTGAPRWVKVFGVIALVVIVAVVVMLLTGGDGGHGPGRHTLPSGIRQVAVLQA